jgi:hypothetical protein
MHTMSRRTGLLIAVALPALLAAAACSGSDDSSSSSSATTSPPATPAAATTAASTTATTESGPPCTADAISTAIIASGAQVTAVGDFKCGGDWAGANYDNPQFTVATLLRAQGGQWVVVDRAQYCSDPSIPADVHFYCTVS